MTPKIFFANFVTPKRQFLEKICVDCGFMVQVAIPLWAVGVRKKKEVKMRSSGNCIFHVYGEEAPLNRLLSFFAHRVISPT
jgi:hypothetical protein